MKINSITSASGWYRVKGSNNKSYVLEEITVWAVIDSYGDNIVVGIPVEDFGVGGNEEDLYLKGIAGYVKESQTEIDSSGNRTLKKNELLQLAWEE